ncbi:MAG: glycosyltransferase family 4 protein [Candidatus Rokubacteria bacterium]|nr:glycosyltransferase family 4 protein [Candidatus Rokubacteria bacterium]
MARGRDAEVNHIVDHGYGHLAYSLDPRRTAVTFHDAMLLKLKARELPINSYPWFTMLGHRLSLGAIARVSRVITPSESARRDLLRLTRCRPERVRVVPLGVSGHFRPPAAPCPDRAPGAAGRPARILHVGHCGPYKNIETILRTIPAIARRLGERVLFTKVGDPFTRPQRALIARLGIDGQVEHLGKVPLERLPQVYAGADLLLMPSFDEGFGLPALEAMACGTPVVVSDRGSLPEVVGDAGLLIPPDDIEALAGAVERVLTDRALTADLRGRGLERARAFTWERTARATLEVYREIHAEAG